MLRTLNRICIYSVQISQGCVAEGVVTKKPAGFCKSRGHLRMQAGSSSARPVWAADKRGDESKWASRQRNRSLCSSTTSCGRGQLQHHEFTASWMADPVSRAVLLGPEENFLCLAPSGMTMQLMQVGITRQDRIEERSMDRTFLLVPSFA